jgi:arylsulfatase A-like enzyme
LTEEALKLVEGRDQSRPFFLNFWHYAVHTPIQAPSDLVRKYEEKARAMGLEDSKALVKGERFPVLHKRDLRVERRMFQSHAAYAAMVENLDWNIGRLLEGLEKAGVLKNTLVVFTSDNGGLSTAEGSPTCNLPLSEGKGWMVEGGTRVCQIVRWAGRVKAGSVCAEPVVSMDWYPTFLEAAGLGARPEQHVDGVSLVPLLEGRGGIQREGIFWHYPHYSNQGDSPACAVRMGDWKLIEHFENGRLELFHLREDVGEERDLSGVEGERVREMHGKLRAWRGEVEAMVPKVNVNWVERAEGVDGAEV